MAVERALAPCRALARRHVIETIDASGVIRTVAVLGNHLPRQCGIATFTTDLVDALTAEFPALDCFVLAMNDPGRRHHYPARVRFEIAETDLDSYRRAADFLNVNRVDVLSVQHEYGIFGGKAGSHLLSLLRELRMPIVTTLHTILVDPNAQQRAAMDELVRLSERLVVMSERGRALLHTIHAVPRHKIDLIPHGIFAAPLTGRSKHQLGVDGKSVILTFGLLSPDKGIEYVIDALPAILQRHPETIYIVLGATHPHVKQHHGETYRLMLEARALRLGVEGSIIFHDRFVSQAELAEFLAAADLYVTPYLKPEQITSGTLAYAVGTGKAVISTPYSYASELLADDRGVLVPWRDATAIAAAANALLGDDAARLAMGRRAAAYGHDMLWPAVARAYVGSFQRADVEHAQRRRNVFEAQTLARRPLELPALELRHLRQLTDDTGVLQHAIFTVPRYADGYCLDDNARALLLVTLIEDAGTEDPESMRLLSTRYLAFVSHAFDADSGRFRNFMSYARHFTEARGSDDSHGRALWALGTVVGRSAHPGRNSLGYSLFHAALGATATLSSPRAWAFTLLGIDEYLRAFAGDTVVEAARQLLADRLFDIYQRASQPEWPWFEESVTYCNARLCQALLVSGARMGHAGMVAAALRSLDWLAGAQLTREGLFAPVGSNGFYQQTGAKARFDQQPVEACAMVAACLEAYRHTGERRWVDQARVAFNWFVGDNELHLSLYDPRSGGCRDGLHSDRVNENQGAESTLSFLLALVELGAANRLMATNLGSAIGKRHEPHGQDSRLRDPVSAPSRQSHSDG